MASMRDPPAHKDHRGVRAIQRMVEFAPSTGGLALWVRHQDMGDGDFPAVMTDGNTVFYGSAFDRLGLLEQTGLVAHEVLHIALRHPQRALDLGRLLGDVDMQLFNICADAIVNSTLAHLNWLRLPASSVFLEQMLAHALDLQQDGETALLEWDVERLYRSIDDRRIQHDSGRERTGRSGGSGAKASDSPTEGGYSPQQTGEPLRPSARDDGPRAARARELGGKIEPDLMPSADADTSPELEAEQAREWSERILRGHAGDGDFSMLRALIADLPRTRTPWRQVLRTRLARGLLAKTGAFVVPADALVYRQPGAWRSEPAPAMGARLLREQDRAEDRRHCRCVRLDRRRSDAVFRHRNCGDQPPAGGRSGSGDRR